MNSICGVFDPLTPTLSRREREQITLDFIKETMLIGVQESRVNDRAQSTHEINSLSPRERARVRGYKKALMQQLLTGKRRVKVDES